ncbi:MAG: hypothetical protein ABIO79_10790 [Ferruginibacter sp.]
MQSKTLLVALSVAAFSSCSTAYKTGQTPDDVYYSPARIIEKENRSEKQEQVRYDAKDDYEITMSIRDRRWRDFRDDYEYNNSPYNYTVCNCMNYGYYYNPYYYPWAIYTTKLYTPVNTTPRMVNLNAYNGYNTKVATGKTTGTITWANPSTQYNNSNRSTNRTESRRILVPRNNNNSSSNETRTYTPSSSNTNSSSGSSSSGSSGSGSVSRPGRGG